jgi:hypothetical protein
VFTGHGREKGRMELIMRQSKRSRYTLVGFAFLDLVLTSGSGRVLAENITVTETIENISIYWQTSHLRDLVLMNGSGRDLDENINVTETGLSY